MSWRRTRNDLVLSALCPLPSALCSSVQYLLSLTDLLLVGCCYFLRGLDISFIMYCSKPFFDSVQRL